MRYLFFLLISFLFWSTYAWDIPESLFTNPDVSLFFIWTIIEEEENTHTIDPYLVMKGNFLQENIVVEKIKKYYGTNDLPQKNDTIIAIITSGNVLDTNWIFKTTGKDYTTLKLVSKKYPMVERYQQYINQGKYIQKHPYREYIEANMHWSFKGWYKYFLLISLVGFSFFIIIKIPFLIEIWSFSQIFLWISLFLRDYFDKEGWFPIKTFIYPNCWWCWSDFPNEWSFIKFLLNWIIRIVISTLLIYVLPKSKTKKRIIFLIVFSLIVMLLWFLYLSIKFD